MKVINNQLLQERIKFRPHPAQLEILNGMNRFTTIAAGRRFGKALWIETPILTEDGWKKMGDIKINDIVFGQDGKKTKVIACSPIYKNHKCYEIIFSDKNKIIADAEHQWEVETAQYRSYTARNDINKKQIRKLELRTTEELSRNLVVYKHREANYSIRTCSPVEFSWKELPLHPYVLGAWLGDGSKDSNYITCFDDQIVTEIIQKGYIVKERKIKGEFSILTKERYKTGNNFKGISYKLKELGVLSDKKIPQIYQFSSKKQRLELLRGLMDTDGYCSKDGYLEYVSIKKELADGVFELLVSLGIKPSLYEFDCTLYGRYIRKGYRICFSTDLPIFHLKRKLNRQKKSFWLSMKRRYIKDIRIVKSVPVKCIEVDNSSKLYLASKGLIATHNSQLCAYIALRELMATNRNIWIVSPTYDLSKKVFNYAVKWIAQNFASTFKIQHAPYSIIESPTGSRLEGKSAENKEALMGEELDLVIVDEASAMSKQIWETYLYPSLANRRGKAFFISTPKQKNWFHHLYIKGKSDRLDDKEYSSFHFQSKDNPYFPIQEWKNAQKTLPQATFDQEYRADFISDAAAVFRNIRSCVKGELKEPEKGHLYVMGVDLAKLRDFTAIVVVDQMDNHVVFVDKFQKIDWTLQKKRITSIARKYNDAYINMDASGKGDPIVDDLLAEGLAVNDFTYTNKSKTQLFAKLSIFIEQNKLTFPKVESLINELEAFGYTKTAGGRFQYSAPEGQHDDQVNALALAVWVSI